MGINITWICSPVSIVIIKTILEWLKKQLTSYKTWNTVPEQKSESTQISKKGTQTE